MSVVRAQFDHYGAENNRPGIGADAACDEGVVNGSRRYTPLAVVGGLAGVLCLALVVALVREARVRAARSHGRPADGSEQPETRMPSLPLREYGLDVDVDAETATFI